MMHHCAEASGYPYVRRTVQLVEGLPKSALNTRERASSLLLIGLGEKNGKLVSSKPPDDVVAPHALQQQTANDPKDLVTCPMAEPIVDRFEVVEVEEDERKRTMGSF